MFIRSQKFLFFSFLLVYLFDFGLTSFHLPKAEAQNNPDCILFGTKGQGTIAPQTYGELDPCNTVTQPTTPIVPTTTPTAVSETKPKATIKTDLFTSNEEKVEKKSLFSDVTKKKLRLEYSGIGKMCQAGVLEAVPWTLTDGGSTIQSAEHLSVVARQALEADHRLRRISINESQIDLYYLEPARIFGFIPVNYTFHITASIDTFEFKLQNPKWLKFATHSHTEIAQTVSTELFNSFNQERINFLYDKNVFIKHAHVIEQTAKAFQNVRVYPFSNSFWICVFIPYFVLFLVLIGIVVGFGWYYLSKKKKKKYISKISKEYNTNSDLDDSPLQSKFVRKPQEDVETLEDYMKSKRQPKEE